MAIKIKKGDTVMVLSGKDKGKNGKVLRIIKFKTDSRVKAVVEGVNIVKKHTKQSATSKGGIESIEMPIHLCKLALQDPKTLKPIAGVAENWKISSDGKVYTFYLRPNAKWSNGDPVTANDFVYSFRRILNPNLGASYSSMCTL